MSDRVVTTGPLFNGNAAGAIAGVVEDFEREFSEYARGLIHARLGRVLKHPTGYYRSRVVSSRVGGQWQVTDSGVIYGPWLEGTGSRNRTTRFKGYATFRKVTQQLDRQAAPFAERLLAQRRGALE